MRTTRPVTADGDGGLCSRGRRPGRGGPGFRARTRATCRWPPCADRARYDDRAYRTIGCVEDPRPVRINVPAEVGGRCGSLSRSQVPILKRNVQPEPVGPLCRRTGESLPVRASSFDLALLSRVIHHLPDRRACAQRLARTLRPGGVIVIRTTFRERLDALVYHYWPSLRQRDAQRFPSQREVLADFTAAGFDVREIATFAQPVVASLREYHARMTTRPQSTFTQLNDRQFQEGLRRLRADADTESPTRPTPAAERYDLAVLARQGA